MDAPAPRGRVILAAAVTTQASVSALYQGLPAVGPSLQTTFDLDPAGVGLLLGGVGLGSALSVIGWGRLLDRIGDRTVGMTGLLGTAGCLALSVVAVATRSYPLMVLTLICAGAFVKLPEIINKRLGNPNGRKVGFQGHPLVAPPSHKPSRPVFEAIGKVVTQDFEQFGMINEIMGRFSTVAALHELGVEEYSAILSDATQNGPWQRHQLIARSHGIRLEITKPAIVELASRAAALGTGARGLQRLLSEAMNRIDKSWPALASEGIGRVVVDEKCVTSEVSPQLISGQNVEERRDDVDLRQLAFAPFNEAGAGRLATVNGITNTTSWSQEQIKTRLGHVESSLDIANTTGSALNWWTAFKQENYNKTHLVLLLAEELAMRKATITEFFLAYVYSNTDSIQGNLHYLDYTRLKKEEQEKQRAASAREDAIREQEREEQRHQQEFGSKSFPPRTRFPAPDAPCDRSLDDAFGDEDLFEQRDDFWHDEDDSFSSDIPF